MCSRNQPAQNNISELNKFCQKKKKKGKERKKAEWKSVISNFITLSLQGRMYPRERAPSIKFYVLQ